MLLQRTYKFIVHVFSEFGPPVPLALDASATLNDVKANTTGNGSCDCGPCPDQGHVGLDDLA